MTDQVNLTEAEKAALAKAAEAGATTNGQPVPAPQGANAPTPAAAPQRPDWLPEKFAVVKDGKLDLEASAAKMAGSYAELEKKTGAPAKTPEQLAAEKAEAEKTEAEKAAAAATPAAAAEAAAKEFAEKGALSAETYAALEKQGYPKHLVDQYIAGQQAAADKLVADAFAVVGGEKEFGELITWARGNLSAEEIAEFDAKVTVPATSKAAVEALAERHRKAVGVEKPLVQGSAPPTGDVFRSEAELKAAMNDKRYQTDEAYRLEVGQKLVRSNAAGTLNTRVRDVTARR